MRQILGGKPSHLVEVSGALNVVRSSGIYGKLLYLLSKWNTRSEKQIQPK